MSYFYRNGLIPVPDMARYHRISIHPGLALYVEHILIQDPATVQPEELRYRVLPKPFPVMGFQYQGILEVERESGPSPLSQSGITGLQKNPRYFNAHPDTRTVLITLKPYGGFALLGCGMDGVANGHVALDLILPSHLLRRVEEQLVGATSLKEHARIVSSFLLGRVTASHREPHPLVMEAAKRIINCAGNMRVETLAAALATSKRQLERLFKTQVGAGPKQFAALVRFGWLLEHFPERRSWADLAFDAGFADQAHFVRSFTQIAGASPTGFMRHKNNA